MSNIINKVKEAVSGHHNDNDNTHSGTHATGTHGAGTHGVGTQSTGTYGTGMQGSGMHNTGTTHNTAGPHSSDMANKMDPRVDLDLDGSNRLGGGGAGYGGASYGNTGTTGLSGQGTGMHQSAGTAGTGAYGTTGGTYTSGPHNSDMMNKMDPRVDSDRDGSRTMGGAGTGYGHTTGGTGIGGTHHAGGYGAQTTSGPHSSDMANKMDPRVDSDRDGSRTMGTGAGIGSAHTHGTHGTHDTYGTHGTHAGGMQCAGSQMGGGPGPAPNTAGPHKSDMMNKMDPRVDSDLDGSNTMGGNKTFSGPTA